MDDHLDSTWLRGVDARAKLVGIFLFVAVSALLTEPTLVFASLALSVAFAALSRLPIRHIVYTYARALPFILLASLSIFLFTGLERGVVMWARISSCVIALIVLASGTETFELFSGLRRLRVPATITTLLMLSQRYIKLLGDELTRMTVARKARAFTGGRSLLDRYALKVVSYTAGMLLVRSSERAGRVYEGLKARGFEKDLAGWRRSRFAARDVSFLASLVATSMLLFVAQLGAVT